MIRFNNDYNCGAHPQILQALQDIALNRIQRPYQNIVKAMI